MIRTVFIGLLFPSLAFAGGRSPEDATEPRRLIPIATRSNGARALYLTGLALRKRGDSEEAMETFKAAGHVFARRSSRRTRQSFGGNPLGGKNAVW